MLMARAFMVVVLLIIPLLLTNLPPLPPNERKGIFIDGNLSDWKDVQGFTDALDDQIINPSTNIVNYKIFFEKNLDRGRWTKLSFYLEVEAFIFGNPKAYENIKGVSYGVHILIDSDLDPETGYEVRGIGADLMVEIQGHSGVIYTSDLKEFDDDLNHKNWNGFTTTSSVPSAMKNQALEAQVYLDHLALEKVDVVFQISDSNGNEDFSDTILSNEEGRLIVTQHNIAPEVLSIGSRDVEFLRLDLEAYDVDIEIESFNLTLFGSAQGSDIEEISLLIEDRNDVLDMNGSKIATATFSGDTVTLKPSTPLKIANETSISLFVTISISPNAVRNRVIGLSINSRKDVVIKSGTVTMQSNIKMVYIGEIPEEVMIDGAFGDWNGVRTYKDIDELPMKNEDVDIDEYKVMGNYGSLSFYFKVEGTMMGGAAIPMVPDYKEYMDIPVPDGDENSASSDIKQEIIPYLEDKIPEELLGEDSLYIFIDSDQNLNTGYSTDWLPIGADHLIKISGKDGNVMEKVSLTFDGESNRDITELISRDPSISNENLINNVTWLRNDYTNIEAMSCSDKLEVKLEGKLGVNDGDVSIFFIVTNWNNREIDNKNLLTSIEFGRSGSRSSLNELVTGIGVKGGDGFGWNVSYAGDVNDDGYDDIIVGAPYTDNTPLGWWDSNWTYRRKLTFNNSGQPETLVNFPVLINLSSSNFDYSKANLDGTDLRFIDVDNTTQLNYHIEDWNSLGYSYVWVNVTNIASSSSTDHIWMYYNNSDASDAQDESGTYDTNFKGVWHLSEDPSATSPQFNDSSSSNNDGASWGAMASNDQVAGKIDGSIDFDGINDMIKCGTTSSLNMGSGDFTLSTWFKTSVTNQMNIVGKGESNTAGKRYLLEIDASGNLKGEIDDDDVGGKKNVVSSGTTYWDGEWHQVIVVRDGNNLRLYIDGNEDSNSPTDITGYGNIDSDKNFTIAAMWDTVAAQEIRFFNGSIDEVSISNIARSSDWIKAQYFSMNNSFTTYGNEEINKTDNGAAHIFFGYPGINMSNINAANANVTINGSNAGDLFGWSVSDAGDVNGDGNDDIIIGAPGYGSDKGRAYIFLGRATGSWSGIDDADSEADVNLSGENDGDRFGCSVSGAGDVNQDGYDDSWMYRKKITINAGQVTDNLVNFPMLINVTDSDLKDRAMSNGYDIFFRASDGQTKLDHEIEMFNSTTGELVAWVRIPSLSSLSDTVIYMHYGDSNSEDQSNPSGVWDDYFGGVWHLSEDPSGSAPQFSDSSGNDNDGTANSLTTSNQVQGKIDGSL
jgi:hypothetical protein